MKRLLLKAAIFLGISLLLAYAIFWWTMQHYAPSDRLTYYNERMALYDAFFVEITILLLLGGLLLFMPPYRPRPDAFSYDVIIHMDGEVTPWEDAGPEKRDRQIGAVLALAGMFLLAQWVLYDPSYFSELLLRWLEIMFTG